MMSPNNELGPCPSPTYIHWANTMCVFDSPNIYITQWISLLVHLAVCFGLFIMYKKCNASLKQMTTPSKYVTYNETYCIMSLYILVIVKVEIVVCFVNIFLTGINCVIPQDVFLT